MKYIFMIVVVFVILIIYTNPTVRKDIKETFSPLIFAQPGTCTSKTEDAYISPVTLTGSNVQSNFKQNGSAINSNSKTTDYYPSTMPNDIYSRKKPCDKPGQLECAVKNLENAYNIPSYVIDESNRQSPNASLYGGQNPKTLIPPMITRPMYSLDWRANPMLVPNKINGSSNENLYLSGYLSKNDISSWDTEDANSKKDYKANVPHRVKEDYEPQRVKEDYEPQRVKEDYIPKVPQRVKEDYKAKVTQRVKEDYEPATATKPMGNYEPATYINPQGNPRGNPRDFIEDYSIDNTPHHIEYEEKQWDDSVITSKGYNPGQFQNNDFPSNLPQGNCGQSNTLKEYNNRLFTTIVQPGTYYKQDVIEQVNANAGISFQQQFLPRTIREVNGGVLIEDHDPTDVPELPQIYEKNIPTIDNTYDPRFNGYGDQTRNYVDDVTGQPRFVYDDINNVKMPNYITRNKLDTFNFGDKYGIAEAHGKSLNDIRGRAESAFLDDSISHRDDMTVRLMRKTNASEWQKRSAPIRTNLR